MSETSITAETCCQDDSDPHSLTPAAALSRILTTITPLADTEKATLGEALNRVLAEDIHSRIDVPNCTNSAMDGYAVQGADIPGGGTRELRIVGTVFAGKPFPGKIESGACARIMTGGVMPAGADTVITQESVERNGDIIRIDDRTRPGDNVREAGEDVRAGDRILTQGARLTPADIGLLASLGLAEIPVTRRPKVAFLSTGDELRSVGETLDAGQVYDSNRYTIRGMLERLGVETIDFGVIRDTREEIERALREAAAEADVVITSGGVSVGEADYVKETLVKLGAINFWKIAIKPGRPLAFGTIDHSYFFGLPGNPVSVMVTFYQFVQPALLRLMGAKSEEPLTANAISLSSLNKAPGRVEYQRGILGKDEQGRHVVRKTGAQGSGILSSMSQANCFIVLPMECAGIKAGMEVEVQPFHGLI
ncbi:MAG: molybdopterin molybdenumtransferase MoeA [Gammaproteobacteria bacterium]|nr:MAG: molybdopterin molybdenumtransferase MoeA [Gammaproteobacteria bacterium]